MFRIAPHTDVSGLSVLRHFGVLKLMLVFLRFCIMFNLEGHPIRIKCLILKSVWIAVENFCTATATEQWDAFNIQMDCIGASGARLQPSLLPWAGRVTFGWGWFEERETVSVDGCVGFCITPRYFVSLWIIPGRFVSPCTTPVLCSPWDGWR